MRPTERINKPWTVEHLRGKDWKPSMDLAINVIKDFHWQLGFGTLLGIIRDGNVIEHDIDLDIDILIPKSNSDIQERLNNIKCKLDAVGCSFMKEQRYGDKLMSLAVLHNGPKIIIDYCIFYGGWGTDYLHIGTHGIVIRPKYSLTTIKKQGYNVPKEYDKYLTGRYGDWRTPTGGKGCWATDANKGNLFIDLK
jgi:phosphorylcholine metabolism protein LicD